MKRSRSPDVARLSERLDALKAQYQGARLDSDPLVFAHAYRDPADREVVAFFSASLAFGRVASIQASLRRVLAALGPSPSACLRRGDRLDLPPVVHRWVTGPDVLAFASAIGDTLRREGSLGRLFASGDEGGPDFVPALDRFYRELRGRTGATPGTLTHGLRFLLPLPGDGSACKRAHLFLRWMVRSKDVDLGLWPLDPGRLLLPMDTHVHRISTYLGLTARPTADLQAAREATAWLSRISQDDPVGYDWALSRLGILAECVTERSRRHCERCAVAPVCRVVIKARRSALPNAASPPE